MTREKTITGWLVVDWKKGNTRTRKSKPGASNLGQNELLARLRVNVTIPDVDVPTLAVDIDVPEPQVFAATLEALDEEDLPDWTDAVSDVLERYGDRVARVESPDRFDELVDQMTTKTLLEVNTRPDPKQVRNYVYRVAKRVAEPDGVDA